MNEGVLHRHENGLEHRHFRAGLIFRGQVIPDHDGSEPHEHGALRMPGEKPANNSGPVIWTEKEAER